MGLSKQRMSLAGREQTVVRQDWSELTGRQAGASLTAAPYDISDPALSDRRTVWQRLPVGCQCRTEPSGVCQAPKVHQCIPCLSFGFMDNNKIRTSRLHRRLDLEI